MYVCICMYMYVYIYILFFHEPDSAFGHLASARIQQIV